MTKLLNQIKRNTNFLVSILKKQSSLLEKIEIIEQIYMNLKFLKVEMKSSEYKEEFQELEKKIDKLLIQLTDTKLMKGILSSVDKLLRGK